MISGVYQIRNIINDHIYIGSTINVKHRRRLHIKQLQTNKHHSRYLQRAWNKYGETAFEFTLLEECEPVKEILLEREQYYLDTLCPEYNILPMAGSSLGVIPTAEARLNMSKAQKGHIATPETREKISLANKGKKRSPEALLNMSLAHMGHVTSPETREKLSKINKGKTMSTETRAKISKAHKGNTYNLGHRASKETREKMSASAHKISLTERYQLMLEYQKEIAPRRPRFRGLAKLFGVSVTTVGRTLNLMEKCRLAISVQRGTRKEYYAVEDTSDQN